MRVVVGLRMRLAGVGGDALWTVVATLVFVSVTVWWLTQETRVPDWDSAKHTFYSLIVHDQLANGLWTAPFTDFNAYPPLGHLIGALGVFVGGYSPAAVILALNVVFVPLLAAACYGVGRLVNGPRAGLLAAVFALGTPIIVSEFHEAYLDPAQTALVAASVWGILAARRFERVGVAALAGVGSGLAMLTKETTPVFLAGILIVTLARGGWRRWRGLVAYSIPVVTVAGPWYIYHATALRPFVVGSSAQANTAVANPQGGTYPTLFSAKNLASYFWDAANVQLRAALLLLFVVGSVAAIRSCSRRWGPENLHPEILGGALVSWIGMTWLTVKDPRYDLPALVYIAVLGTGWIATARPRVRPVLTGALLAAVAASFASVAFGIGGIGYMVRVALPGGADTGPQDAHYITLYSTSGWLRGAPDHNNGDVLALMQGLRRAGVQGVGYCCVNLVDFNISGLSVLARQAGLTDKGGTAGVGALGPKDAFLLFHAPKPGDPPPCQTMRDSTGIYAELGNPVKPFSQYTFICPGHHPEIYKVKAQSGQPPGFGPFF